MKRVSVVYFVAALILLFCGLAQAAPNSFWGRMGAGFANPVAIHDYVYKYESPLLEVSFRIPQLSGAPDLNWQKSFNEALIAEFQPYLQEVQEMAEAAKELQEQGYYSLPYQALVEYEVKLNRGGLLSLAISSYAFTGGAHGMTYYKYLNVDLTTGRQIVFKDLLDTDSELERAANLINDQIAADLEWYFIEEFTVELFQEQQDFYLEEDQAVICFGLYEIAPYAAGIQEFAVPAP